MDDTKKLGELSDQDLLAELVRRRQAHPPTPNTEADFLKTGQDLTHQLLQAHYQHVADSMASQPQPCPRCKKLLPPRDSQRERTIIAVSGKITFKRSYHYCSNCKYGFCPADKALDIPERGNLTKEMQKRVLDFGVNDTFEEAAQRWNVHYSTKISNHLVRNVVDHAGQDLENCNLVNVYENLFQKENSGQLIISMDGSMVPVRNYQNGWKEIKLGLVIRGEHYKEKDGENRGEVTQSIYVAEAENLSKFKDALDEAINVQKVVDHKKTVVLGDGAPWIWNIADEICYGAHQVLDWYHAIEASYTCLREVFEDEPEKVEEYCEKLKELSLQENGVNPMIIQLNEIKKNIKENQQDLIRKLETYYENNRERMKYYEMKSLGFPIGSGFIESAHKHVLQTRLKRAGQHWGVKRAGRMAKLRALYRTVGPEKLADSLRLAA